MIILDIWYNYNAYQAKYIWSAFHQNHITETQQIYIFFFFYGPLFLQTSYSVSLIVLDTSVLYNFGFCSQLYYIWTGLFFSINGHSIQFTHPQLW